MVVKEAEAVEAAADLGVEAVEVEVVSLVSQPPDIRAQSIQIFRKASGRGARCTSAGVEELFSVPSRRRVLGRMYSLPNQVTDETGANSPILQENQLISTK